MLKNFWVTLRYLFKRKVTLCYPEQRQPIAERARGMLQLQRNEDGSERCIGCRMCERSCPSGAIKIRVNKSADGTEKVEFELDLFKCMSCGMCVSVCPVSALRLTACNCGAFEDAKRRFLNKQQLLAEE